MKSRKFLLYMMSFLIVFSSVIHPSVLIADTVDDDAGIEASDLDFNELTVDEEIELETESTFEVFSDQQTSGETTDDEFIEDQGAKEEEPIITEQEDEVVEEPPQEPIVENDFTDEETENVEEEFIEEEEEILEEDLTEEDSIEEEIETDMGMGVLNVTGGPGAYTPDSGTLSLNVTLDGVSTNTHTRPVRIWTQNGLVHIAVKATHDLDNMTVRGVGTNMLHKYGAGEHITIDGQSYNPADGLQGNTKDAHFTIFTIDRASLGDINDPNFTFYITGIGGGHNVGGTFIVDIPSVSATVDKTWIDGPMTPVTVDLLRDGVVIDTIVLSVDNPSYYWDSLLYTDAVGDIYDYMIRESDPGEGYTVDFQSSYDSGNLAYTFTLTNTYTSPVTDITVQKIWNDENNNDGKRPDSVEFQLLRNGESYGEPVTMVADNGWSHTFSGLPVTDTNGNPYTYTVIEVNVPDGYTSEVNGLEITNSYTPERINIEGTKIWNDGDNQDGKRPDEITVHLMVGEEIIETLTVTADDDWSYEFTNLLKYNEGIEIDYHVSEVVPDDYTVTYNGFDIKNSYTPEKTNISVQKIWDDMDNNDGVRPESIEVQLLADDVEIGTATLNADNNWSFEFKNLPVYRDGGIEIAYTVAELNIPDGYTSEVDGFEITNTRAPETIDIPVVKIWDDMDNNDGVRPSSIDVRLLADDVEVQEATLTAENNWTYEFTDLLVYRDGGTEIVYSIEELNIPNEYTSEINGSEITNSYTPERIDIEGMKTWYDSDNQDGNRPDEISVQLMMGDEVVETLTVTADDDWAYEFTNLLKFNNGVEVEYHITEVLPEGYSVTYDGYDITNSYTPEETSVTATKYWDDNENQDGVRPESVFFQLNADGNPVGDAIEISEDTDWRYTWTGLPVYDDGTEIDYTVVELSDDDNVYEVSVTEVEDNQFVVTNSYTPETMEIPVTKIWNDADNQDGLRPAEIKVNLLANGDVMRTARLDADKNWSHVFESLPVNQDGEVINYSIEEDGVPEGYASVVDGFEITNSHTPDTLNIPVKKFWEDMDNNDGLRPASVDVRLFADDVEIDSETIRADDNWSYTFRDLPVYRDGGIEIKYSIEELNVPDGYTSDVDGFEIFNTHVPERIDIEGTKSWDDGDNQDGNRPNAITVHLMAGEEILDTVTVTEEDDWEYAFTNLLRFHNGSEFDYRVVEVAIDDYTATYDGHDITNSYTPEETGVTVLKIWDDNDDQDGHRAEFVLFQLKADGMPVGDSVEVSEDTNWRHTWTELPVFNDGQPIVYTVEEVTDTDNMYEQNITEVEENQFVVTNSYTPEIMDIPVTKTWDDMDNNDGVRPASVEVHLFADDVEIHSATLTADDDWSHTFRNLPVYRDGGSVIEYTVEELVVPDGYTSAVDGFEVTNSYVPERIDIEGTKSWNDGNNQDGNRPDEITIHLMNGEEILDTITVTEEDDWEYAFTNLLKFNNGTEVQYRVVEIVPGDYTTTYDGYDIFNSYTPEETGVTASKHWEDMDNQDGIRPDSVFFQLYGDGNLIGEPVEISEDNDWRHTWTELPVFSGGQPIVYTVGEISDTDYGYEVSVTEVEENQFVVTNSHTPETMDIPVTKFWDDMDNNDGVRPPSIEVQLFGDNVELLTATLTADDDWSHTFTGLPVYRDGGIEIQYSIEELNVPDGYTAEVDGFEITNSYVSERISIAGIKSWDDGNNQDGNRPDTITIHLMAGDEIIDTVTVSAEDDWEYAFTDLLRFNNGVELEYHIVELVPEDYSVTYDGYDLINSYTPEQTSVTASKHWDDGDNQDGHRPRSVYLQLRANGQIAGTPVEVSDANDWTHTWTGLSVFSNGTPVEYTVEELLPSDSVYEATVTEVEDNQFAITNSHTPATMDIPVTKVWDDADNQDGNRPEAVQIQLVADGSAVGEAVHLSSVNDWSHVFAGLPVYDNGMEIVYTVEEFTDVDVYDVAVAVTDDGFVITNSYTPETVDVAGTKTWDDGNNQDGNRPDAITVNLMVEDEIIDTLTVTAADEWAYAFNGLPMYDNGVEIEYRVVETGIDDYTTTYNGYDITNSYTPGETGRTVVKVWDDGGNQDGNRPDAVQVQLFADGSPEGDPDELSADTEWRYSWTGLPMMDNGTEVVYTVEELNNDVYDVTITELNNEFIVINSYTPETVEIAGVKTWDDNDNEDNMRPASISVHLHANGEVVDTVIVTEDANWTYEFTDLPVYENGEAITYTISESPIDHYVATYDGFDITNTYVRDHTGVTVTKVWKDYLNKYNTRAPYIEIQLIQNDERYGEPVRLSAANDWEYGFTNLPMYVDGEPAVYRVIELTELEGYRYEIYEGYLGYFTMVNILTDIPAEPETPPTPTVPVADDPEELPRTGLANENSLMALLIVLLGISGLTLLFRRRINV